MDAERFFGGMIVLILGVVSVVLYIVVFCAIYQLFAIKRYLKTFSGLITAEVCPFCEDRALVGELTRHEDGSVECKNCGRAWLPFVRTPKPVFKSE